MMMMMIVAEISNYSRENVDYMYSRQCGQGFTEPARRRGETWTWGKNARSHWCLC